MDSLQAKFSQIVQRELDELAKLEEILRQEHDTLKQRDSDALIEITQVKQKLIESVESFWNERLVLLQGAGYSTDKEAVLNLVSTDSQLVSQWDELESVLLNCQQQNQVNGLLVDMSRQQTQQLLSILLGEDSLKGAELYDAKGSTSSSFSNSQSVKV